MVERQHRVRLAAPEVGLQLHHRVAAFAGEALDAARQQPLQAFGEERAPEELPGVAVLLRALAQVNLPQVRGELRLLVAAAGHVGVRGHHLAPGLESPVAYRLDKPAYCPTLLPAHLLVEHPPAQLQLHLCGLGRLGGGNRGEKTFHGVEGAVGVVAGEALLVSPLVAPVAKLIYQAALGGTEGVAEHVVPGFPHHPEKGGGVPFAVRFVDLEAAERVHVDGPVSPDFVVQLAFDERGQSFPEPFQSLADAVVIGDGHAFSYFKWMK